MKITHSDNKIDLLNDKDKLVASLSYSLNGDKAEVICCGSKTKRKGYTTDLFQEFEEVCRDNGINTIHLTVGADNIPARNLYKKLGFKPLGNEDVSMRQRRRLNMGKNLYG